MTDLPMSEHLEPGWRGFAGRYRATVPAVLAYLLRATGNDRALAEDLTSNVYVRAMQI